MVLHLVVDLKIELMADATDKRLSSEQSDL